MKHSLAHLQDLIPTLAGIKLCVTYSTSFVKFKIFAFIFSVCYRILWLVATTLSGVCMDYGNLVRIGSPVHGIIGSDNPACTEESIAKNVE